MRDAIRDHHTTALLIDDVTRLRLHREDDQDTLDLIEFEEVRGAAARAGIRLWANTLTSVGVISIIGMGGDEDALRDSSTWRNLLSNGITIIQTDEPGALEDYLRSLGSSR